jgi:hypothetical protein
MCDVLMHCIHSKASTADLQSLQYLALVQDTTYCPVDLRDPGTHVFIIVVDLIHMQPSAIINYQ